MVSRCDSERPGPIARDNAMTDLILYTTDDGKNQIRLRTEHQTVWLTQLEMAELFDATKQNISLHLKNVFQDRELYADAVVKESLTTAADGKRYATQLYNMTPSLPWATGCGRRVGCSSAAGRLRC